MSRIKGMAMEWVDFNLIFIDQRKLPLEEVYVHCTTYTQVASAIKNMTVRGAPAIGASAAFGYVLGAKEFEKKTKDSFILKMAEVKNALAATRPTAVNLFWALERMERKMKTTIFENTPYETVRILEDEAIAVAQEDIKVNQTLGEYGAQLIKDGDTVLTHCNAGALATFDYGTALGVIRAAVKSGKKIKVYADETRPYLQGARLTVWELMKDNIDVTLISDNMAGWVMHKGLINAVIVGADRIAANGDTANKIGTYSVSILAKYHSIPFYIAAPVSTIDIKSETGDDIPIEERDHNEVRYCHKLKMVPDSVKVFNPSFDVTPHINISGIITEKGVLRTPYDLSIKKILL